MGKILGLLFNRWTLGLLLLAAFLAVLWFIGPLVAVGTWRPFESTTSRWIVTGLVLLVVVALVAWRPGQPPGGRAARCGASRPGRGA